MTNPAPRRPILGRAAEYLAGLAERVAPPKPKRKRLSIEAMHAEQRAAEFDAQRWRDFGRGSYHGPPLF
ncbi:unnamed protein product [Gemmataceae bacterium]|nr:unnamed protein product [Gemmataceae bacterium]VTT99072.1 unnamed protein product [Gemmataceae bacterium]